MAKRHEFFARNVKNADLLREFVPNYRLSHTDRDGLPLKVGDDVRCVTYDDSWIHGELFVVLKLGVVSRAEETDGHLLQADDGITVAPVWCIVKG